MAIPFNQAVNASVIPADLSSAFAASKPLLVYLIGIVIYSLFIFKLYRFVAHKDILKLQLHTYYHGVAGFFAKLKQFFLYVLEYIILVPLVIFFWFAFLATALFVLGSNLPEQVLLISMALVGAIRVTAYYSEDLSRDLSKMLPFGLLAVFMVDISIISATNAWDKFLTLFSFPDLLLSYLLFVIILEVALRILLMIIRFFVSSTHDDAPDV